MAKKDYYEILGVGKDASADEIRRQYHKLSMKYHPDRQAGKSDAEKKEAEEKFKEAAEAYSVLSDAEKRRKYDQFGPDGEEQFGGFGFGGIDPMEIYRAMHGRFGGAFDDLDDGFSPFGFSPRGGSREAEPPDMSAPEDGADVQARVSVSFKEAVNGCEKEFGVTLDKPCPKCGGTGAEKGSSPSRCQKCHGSGRVASVRRMGPMISQTVTPCPECGGAGWSFDRCPECGGAGRVTAERRVKTKVPAGFRDGQRLRLKGLGRCGLNGGKDGDMYVVVSVAESDLFVRSGDDVGTVVFVSPATASLGGEVDVPTPYGFRKVRIQPGTASGAKIRVAGAGVKTSSGAGDLVARVEIEPYASPSGDARRLLEELRRAETPDALPLSAKARRAAEAYYAE